MEGFRQFVQQPPAQPGYKPWSMDKQEIIRYWQTLRDDRPIQFAPLQPGQTGSTFGQDGIRISGSRPFIDSVLGRLKDAMRYEGPNTTLSLVYRQVPGKHQQAVAGPPGYVFYAHVKQRSDGQTDKTPGID
jgi:hypothetical protein